MALDPYQYCPCGSGNKIKFCCSKDIVPELQKIIRALEADQRVSAKEQILRTIEKKGKTDALLTMLANAQLRTDDPDGAKETVAELQKRNPESQVGWALEATLTAMEGDASEAMEQLQKSLEYADSIVSSAVYSAMSVVAHALLNEGKVLAARGLWLMQARMTGEKNSQPVELLGQLNAQPEINPLIKQDFALSEAPEGVPWGGEYNVAMKLANRGAWQVACESLLSLSQKVPNQPQILRNIAILRTWLGEQEEAATAWKNYAAVDDVTFDESVDALALAQVVGDAVTKEPMLDEVLLTYEVEDVERIMETLLSDKRVSRSPIDPAQLAQDGSPPPKGLFWLLDRELPEGSDETQLSEVPLLVGELFVFGRQTDRPPVVDFKLTKTKEFGELKGKLKELLGDLLPSDPKEEKIGSIAELDYTINWQMRLPAGTGPARRRELTAEKHEQVLLNEWPKIRQAILGGKTPEEASQDEQLRRSLAAAVYLLELSFDSVAEFDFNRLRERVGLPAQEPVGLAGRDIRRFPLTRLRYLDPDKLTTDELVVAFERAAVTSQQKATATLGRNLLTRDGLDQQIDPLNIYDVLIAKSQSGDQALELLDEAKSLAAARGISPAKFLLNELMIRIPRLESDRCNQLVQTIQTRHINEPGVAEQLYQILVTFGLITPDGRPAAAPGAAPGEAAGQPAQGSQLWTPDSGSPPTSPPAGEPEQKSKLWVPGMD